VTHIRPCFIAVFFCLISALAIGSPDAAYAQSNAIEPPPGATTVQVTSQRGGVAALGRIEPEYGIIRLGAPAAIGAATGSLITELRVEEGDHVRAGDELAITDVADMMNAALSEAKARLELVRSQARAAVSEADEQCTLAEVREREATRREALLEQNLTSREETELARGNAKASRARCTSGRDRARAVEAEIPVAEAAIERARTEVARTRIVAPFDGKILEVLARPGELVTSRGALELGRVDRMMAVAEVYEADIHRVRVGQRASVSSPALGDALSGTVERIRPKVQKQDVTDTDPAARKDARIVEVEVLLDDAEAAENLTHLQVTVVIDS